MDAGPPRAQNDFENQTLGKVDRQDWFAQITGTLSRGGKDPQGGRHLENGQRGVGRSHFGAPEEAPAETILPQKVAEYVRIATRR